MDTVPASHKSPRGLSRLVSSNYPARAPVGQNTSCPDLPQGSHNMSTADAAQKIAKVARSGNNDT